MNFFAAQDLMKKPKAIWDTLQNNSEAIITNNGYPARLMEVGLV